MLDDVSEWISFPNKIKKNVINKEKVTIRGSLSSKNISLRVSIGLTVADLLGFKVGDYVNIFSHRKKRNILLIKKCIADKGHKLSHSKTSNFLTFDFVCGFSNDIKIKQTIDVDYDITEENYLLINLMSIKWRV